MNELNTALNTFNDIKDEYLRAYNRLVVTFNLTSNDRRDEAKVYLNQFNDADKVKIAVVSADIKYKGFTAIKKKIQNKLANLGELVDDIEGARDIA